MAHLHKLGAGCRNLRNGNPSPLHVGDFREGKDSSGGARDFIALTALSIGYAT
jgi:hypothetical protein